jgi:hypothetical protein
MDFIAGSFIQEPIALSMVDCPESSGSRLLWSEPSKSDRILYQGVANITKLEATLHALILAAVRFKSANSFRLNDDTESTLCYCNYK